MRKTHLYIVIADHFSYDEYNSIIVRAVSRKEAWSITKNKFRDSQFNKRVDRYKLDMIKLIKEQGTSEIILKSQCWIKDKLLWHDVHL